MRDPITALGLEPHPEGGYYRRTFTAPDSVGDRPAVTLIYFFLPAGDTSAWHMVKSDEMWLWHGPGALQLQCGGNGEQPEAGEILVLGPQGACQILIPAGTWQRTLPGTSDVLVSCMVTPGFDFADFRLAVTSDTGS